MKQFRMKLLMTLAFCLLSTVGKAQHLIKGTVSDSQGPLIGATVKVKDAQTGTTTDLDGNYQIQVKSKKAMLVFSSVGYQDKAVIVGDQKVIDVVLVEDIAMLDETVVIGYGTQTKSHLTGSISKLNGDELTNAPVSDVTQALQGMMSGLTVSNLTSEVGVMPSIRVRGTGSISADSEPLIIIDGFPIQGGLSQINAADIKSIEILKDAASAAIYGSRAANGVIMITTKSGTPDKPKYSFKFYEGWKYAYKLHDMMTSTEWYELQKQEEAMGGPAVTRQARGSAWLEQKQHSQYEYRILTSLPEQLLSAIDNLLYYRRSSCPCHHQRYKSLPLPKCRGCCLLLRLRGCHLQSAKRTCLPLQRQE